MDKFNKIEKINGEEKKQSSHNEAYRVLDKIHYSTEKEFATHKERMAYLINYAREAQRIYEEYKDSEKIKNQDEETQKKFHQYELYKSYDNELILVEIFRDKVKKASRIAVLIKEAEKEFDSKNQNSKEKLNNLRLRFAIAKAEVDKMIDQLGPLLEYTHRRYLQKERKYFHQFNKLSKEEAQLKLLSETPIGETATAQKLFEQSLRQESELDEKAKKHLKQIAQGRDYLREEEDLPQLMEDNYLLSVLQQLSDQTGEDLIGFAEAKLQPEQKPSSEPKSKQEIKERLAEVTAKLDKLWGEDWTRYFVYQNYLEHLIGQNQFGEPVLEIPSVISRMNKIYSWEMRHTETPIGAVLIGPPGTGKSLILEHYLAKNPEHKKKGPPVIIDMSQETTEFILLGGEKVEIGEDKTTLVNHLRGIFDKRKEIEDKLSSFEFTGPEKEELLSQKKSLDTQVEDLIHILLGHYVEFREKVGDSLADTELKVEDFANGLVDKQLPAEIKKELEAEIKKSLNTWQALELGKIMYKNGWRDGIILKALKEGRDIIINEYNNFRISPDALRQLFQTAYGGKWFFAGTGKEYPVHSKIYLTANAGSSAEQFFYDTAQVTAAFESRLPAPIVVNLPSTEEELLIVQASLSDLNKRFLANQGIETKLQAVGALKDYEFILKYNEKELIVYLFSHILPKLRALASEAPKEVPSLDLRHVNRFLRDLINPFNRERTNISLEEAFVSNFMKPFLSNPTAFETLVASGIIEEMYKVGLLHQTNNEEIKNFLFQTIAYKDGLNWEGVSQEAKRNVLTKIEEKLQTFDQELISNLEKMDETKWSEFVKKAKKEKKVFIPNPYLKTTFTNTFSKESSRPEAVAF